MLILVRCKILVRKFLMVKKGELFRLIKSMSRSEKRYFKLYTTHDNGSANYIKLFDAIDEQEEYDEVAIKTKFAGASFIKQLHVTKNYLHGLILDSLRSFHGNISKDAELKDYLRNVELLFNKELYVICETELRKAEKIAEEYELLTGRIEVMSWKRKLKQALEPYNYEALNNIVAEQGELIDTLSNSNTHWKAMVTETWKAMSRNVPKEIVGLKVKPKQATTLDALVLQHNTAYIKHFSKGISTKAEKELRKLIALLEEKPKRLLEDPAPYISTVNNLASYLVFSKRDKDALELINKAKEQYNRLRITTEKKSMLKQILRTYNLELELYRDSKNKPDLTMVADTGQFVMANKNKLPKEYLISLWYQLAYIYYEQGEYENAQSWINNILNSKFPDMRLDLQKYARMLNMVIHFEQKNYFVLRYFAQSTRRFIQKHSVSQPYDEPVIKFFIKASDKPEYEHKELYKELYCALFPEDGASLIPDGVLDYLDYKSWLVSRVKR